MAKKGAQCNTAPQPKPPAISQPCPNTDLRALLSRAVKSRVVSVRLLSMAMTGFFYQFTRPRTSPPMSMLKYDPIGTAPPIATPLIPLFTSNLGAPRSCPPATTSRPGEDGRGQRIPTLDRYAAAAPPGTPFEAELC